MHFDFHDAKNASNLLKHGIDLVDASRVFLDPHRLEFLDERKDYVEERRIAVGAIGLRVFVVVSTPRANAIRLISARRANEREQRKYHSLRA